MIASYVVGRVFDTINGTLVGSIIGIGLYIGVGGELKMGNAEIFLTIVLIAFVASFYAAVYFIIKPIPGVIAGFVGGLIGFGFVYVGIPDYPVVNSTLTVSGMDIFIVKLVTIFIIIPLLPAKR